MRRSDLESEVPRREEALESLDAYVAGTIASSTQNPHIFPSRSALAKATKAPFGESDSHSQYRWSRNCSAQDTMEVLHNGRRPDLLLSKGLAADRLREFSDCYVKHASHTNSSLLEQCVRSARLWPGTLRRAEAKGNTMELMSAWIESREAYHRTALVLTEDQSRSSTLNIYYVFIAGLISSWRSYSSARVATAAASEISPKRWSTLEQAASTPHTDVMHVTAEHDKNTVRDPRSNEAPVDSSKNNGSFERGEQRASHFLQSTPRDWATPQAVGHMRLDGAFSASSGNVAPILQTHSNDVLPDTGCGRRNSEVGILRCVWGPSSPRRMELSHEAQAQREAKHDAIATRQWLLECTQFSHQVIQRSLATSVNSSVTRRGS